VAAADDKVVVGFLLSGGNANDTPKDRGPLRKIGAAERPAPLLMDRAYEGAETRALAVSLGYVPVAPPKRNRREPWDYGRDLHKMRNEVERFFRRCKRFRRVCTRYDKPGCMFLMLFLLAVIYDLLT
jgi:transposase